MAAPSPYARSVATSAATIVSKHRSGCDLLALTDLAVAACTYGSCGSGTTARCLQSNEVCQSGVPVVRSAKRDIHGTRCTEGERNNSSLQENEYHTELPL